MKLKNDFTLNKIDKTKGLVLPSRMSNELAELIGIHYGDGYMSKEKNFTYRIFYSCNIHEKEYVGHIIHLFNNLFNCSLKVNTDYKKSYIKLYFHSKSLCNYFNEVLKIPFSPKIDLKIPSYIKEDKTLLLNFIRGLFDTDGCFTVKRDKGYEYNLAKISTKWFSFAKDIKEAFDILEIKSFVCKKCPGFDVVVGRKNEFQKFLEIVTPKNKKVGTPRFELGPAGDCYSKSSPNGSYFQ